MYDKNQIEDSLEFVRQIKDFYENDDFLTDFDPLEEHGDAELFANLAGNLEQKNRPMESVAQGAQTTGAGFASSEQEKRRQLEEERIEAEKRAAQEERRLLEEERRRLQQEIKQRELQEKQRAAQEERRRQAEIEAERRRIEKERQAALEEQRKQEELRKQIEEERRRLAEEQRLAAERRAAEEKLAAERRAAEEERRRVEQERQAALEEQRKIEEERRRLAAEQKLAAERRAAEEKLAAERRAVEEKMAAERRAAEEERRRIEQERQRLVEERLQREIEEQKRLVAEQRRREEEEKRRREAEEKKRRQEMVLAEERRRKELEEEERRKAAREQEERIAAEKKRQEAELAEQQRRKQILEEQQRLQTEQQQAAYAEQSDTEKKDEEKPETTAQEEAAISATPIINIATPNTSTDKSADTEVSRLQKRAKELQRQAEMATLEARMRQLQLESQAAQGVYPKPQINIPNAGNATADGALPVAQISIPGAVDNTGGGNNGSKKMSKDEIDNIFLQELQKFQGDDESASGRMKSEHPLQKYINNFDGKTFSSIIPAEKILDAGYKVKDVIDDQIWNIKHFIQKKIDNSGDIETQQKTRKILSNLVVVVICVFFAYLIAMMITHFVAHPTKVEGESMETTLTNGDTVVIQKMSYYLGHPERYDVVVFPVPNYNSKTYYIKRVIGLPGETVQIKDGKVYIDDKELDSDKYGKDEYINDPGDVAEPVTLAKNEYFVLGDNRNMSTDSRSSYVGMVKERYIIGKAWERIWPLSKLGSIGK